MKEHTPVIFESPDGGRTVFARPFGASPEQRVPTDLDRINLIVDEAKQDVLWSDIRSAATKDPVLQDLLDRARVYYELTNTN